jgi:hypothetical protein
MPLPLQWWGAFRVATQRDVYNNNVAKTIKILSFCVTQIEIELRISFSVIVI